MTSTGSSSATATVRHLPHMCNLSAMKPIMGSLVQIKSDTFAAWTGGISQIHPILNNSGFCEQSKGLDVKFLKEEGDLFSFQHKLLQHFQDMGMNTITYLKDLGDPTKMVNLLMDHTQFTQAYIKTAIEEQCKLYDSYNHSNDCSACYSLLDTFDISFKQYIKDHLPNDFCLLIVWMQVIKAL